MTFLKLLTVSVLCYIIIILRVHPTSSNSSKNNSNFVTIKTNYVDLSYTAEKTVHEVVHIKTDFMRRNLLNDYDENAQNIVTLNNKRT
jgi:hypothetical protein